VSAVRDHNTETALLKSPYRCRKFTSKRPWHVGDSDIVVSESKCKVFNPEPDKWDLDTSSLVLQLMHGFHGVNGTAAVSLTGELHAAGRSCYIFRFA
jgi:hypothetical protein